MAWHSPPPSTATAPRSTSCGQHQSSIASFRTPQSFSPVNLVTGALVGVTPISATMMLCHPVARNKAVLLVSKSVPLLLHVRVGGTIEASLPCYHECDRMSPAPASKHPLRELIVSFKGFEAVSCETVVGLFCRKANQHEKKGKMMSTILILTFT
ncbi:uncharacterized protein LOC110264078 [Arachis ipaensis]|uniref:uncharacterized protein LOC110264078 n=1 Tax=Arachis ipaensis TaxID=130454 RepID=UPI000A2B0699|nr:uncharacterized protein LOC110264078 [Arachis ipaensis]